VDELILFVCVLFFVYIYFKQDEMPVEESKSLGWVIIFIMLFSILKNLFVLLYFGFLNMRKKMKSMFSAEDEALDSPHTSDGNSDTIDSIPTEEIEDEVRREVYEKQEYNERIKQRQDERGIKNKDGSQFNNNMQQQQYNPYAQGNPMMMMAMGPPMMMMYPGQMMMAPPGAMMYQDPNAIMEIQNFDDQEAEEVTPFEPKQEKAYEMEDYVPKAKQKRQNNFFGDATPGINAN
jgi:hypothetical protein